MTNPGVQTALQLAAKILAAAPGGTYGHIPVDYLTAAIEADRAARDRQHEAALGEKHAKLVEVADKLATTRARLGEAVGRAAEACESLGTWAADAIQVGEDGPECRACGHILDDKGRGHSRCAVPIIEDALRLLASPKSAAPPKAAPPAGQRPKRCWACGGDGIYLAAEAPFHSDIPCNRCDGTGDEPERSAPSAGAATDAPALPVKETK